MSTVTTVRQSFAATYDGCPKAAQLSLGVSEYSTHQQARGTICHEFNRRVVTECVQNGEATYPTEMAKPLMVEVINDLGLPIDAKEFDNLMGLAWRFCDVHSFDVEKIIDLEENYTAEIAGVTVTGRPDVLEIDDRMATVRDYKSGFAIDPETEFQGSFQGRWYGLLVLHAYPQVHTVRLCWEYLRWQQTREAEVHRHELPDIEAMLASLIARIDRSRETGEWSASPGKWCSLCPAPSECPIPREYRGDGSVASPEDAQAVAGLLVSLDAVRKQAQKSLRAYCAEHGPVDVGGLRWDFKPRADSDKITDRDGLKAAMASRGLRYEDYFKRVHGGTEFRAQKIEGQHG